MRTWVVKVRVPGAEGAKTSSESYLVQADNPSAACAQVNEHLAKDDLIGGDDCADTISVKESTLISLIPFKKSK